jgi:hypothetical protein
MNKDMFLRSILPISLLFSGSLILGNLAYLHLSISFIQMLKVCSVLQNSCRSTYFGIPPYLMLSPLRGCLPRLIYYNTRSIPSCFSRDLDVVTLIPLACIFLTRHISPGIHRGSGPFNLMVLPHRGAQPEACIHGLHDLFRRRAHFKR